MIDRVIDWSVRNPWSVYLGTLLLMAWAVVSIRETPLDAVPDLSDPQVIVFTEWMGRSPDLVEDQITYPLVRALQSTPGVSVVRGYSMFGMSFVYVIFDEGTDPYWARSRVLEQLGRVEALLPGDARPILGPDASGVGWIYQYILQDRSGRLDLAQLRELQEFTISPALQAVAGVSEVATFGGFERQFQVILDPHRLVATGVGLPEVMRAVQDANSEVGGSVVEWGGREYALRGRGYVHELEDLAQSVVRIGPAGTPVRLSDLGAVQYGPRIRRGAADWNAQGEAVGGIVIMRIDSNALQVIDALKEQIARLNLPEGVHLIPTYDRSELIRGSIDTLTDTLLKEILVITLISLLFLLHFRSALIAVTILLLSVLFSFIAVRHLGLTTNIMSLGGIAIALVELADAAIVLIENAHMHLARARSGEDRRAVIAEACKEVGRPIFFSLVLMVVSFLPIFTLTGQAGRLFDPLAYTKTFSIVAAAVLTITLAPPLMVHLLKGRIRDLEENPVNRLIIWSYRPVVGLMVRWRRLVVVGAIVVMAASVPAFMSLGSEFMPPLDEGSLLVMPTTLPGISIEEARRAMAWQHAVILDFEEVGGVHGKAGRAETATDPAALDMIESVVTLRPREQWPEVATNRWHSAWSPGWMKPALNLFWPEQRARTTEELASAMEQALRMPGYQIAISPPIRTRIDMLTTGVRTPVGVKVFGEDLLEIERVAIGLADLFEGIPGTRSAFAERQSGLEYIDVTPNREIIARYGLTVRDVHDLVESAIGGMEVSTAIVGRSRFSINLRFGADFRDDPEAIRELLVRAPVAPPAFPLPESAMGAGASPPADRMGAAGMPSMGSPAAMGGMSGMGEMGATGGAGEMMETSGAPATGGPAADPLARWRVQEPVVPLGLLADVRVVDGPPMIKNENGMLVGYVFVDIDTAERDLGGWVEEARRRVDETFALPPGYVITWTGQYEFMAEAEARLRVVIPLTLALILLFLYLSMRGWPQTFLVLLSLPFSLAGSIFLLSVLDYNLSTAVWVGLIAVGGVAAQVGIIMVVYMDQAFARARDEGRIRTPRDVDAPIVEAASLRARPVIMASATTVLGLLPLLWESGVGADVSARTAAPVVGGLVSCLLLTLLVLPAVYVLWRRWQLRPGAAEREQVGGTRAGRHPAE